MGALTFDEVHALQLTLLVVNILSCVVSGLLVAFYALFKRHFPHTGVLAFGTCAFFLSASLLLGPIVSFETLGANTALCQAQGFLIQFFGMTGVMYYFAIVLSLVSIVTLRDLEGERRPTRAIFYGQHPVAIGVGLFTAILSIGIGDFTFRGTWCWISGTPPWLEMAYFYAPMAFVSFVSVALWIRVMCAIRGKGPQFLPVLARHLVMAAVFFVLFTAMFTHRLYNAITGQDSFVLILLHIVALGGIGVWLFLVFGLSRHNLVLLQSRLSLRRDYAEIN